MAERRTDILIVGGGAGGCAEAMAATSLGNRVVMTEETSWIGAAYESTSPPPADGKMGPYEGESVAERLQVLR